MLFLRMFCWSCGRQEKAGVCVGCGRAYCSKCQLVHDCPNIDFLSRKPRAGSVRASSRSLVKTMRAREYL